MVEVSCIVVAGGQSLRMGSDKRLLELNGKNFLEIAVENANKISRDVVVSLGDESQVKSLKDAKYVIDEEKVRGPLFGLFSALKLCKKKYVAVVPLDAPLLKTGIYKKMITEIIRDTHIDAVIPIGPKGPEPLHGVYNTKNFLKACEMVVSKGGESVVEAVNALEHVKFLKTRVFADLDPKLLSFYNVNTPTEFQRLKEMLDDKKRA